MKSRYIPTLIIIITLAFSCEKGPYIEGMAGELVGNWIEPVYSDSLMSYSRASDLLDNEPGISFMEDGTLLERKNSGFCGTPPISYADFNGYWSSNDSIIDIRVDFWGGIINMEWKIISITETRLEFFLVSQELLFEE